MTLYPGDPKLGLNNITIGGPENHRVGIAFKAQFNSPLAAVRFYLMTGGAGYAAGTGGKIKYELYSDNNGVPAIVGSAPVIVSGAQKIQLFADLNGAPGPLFFSGWTGSAPAAPAPSGLLATGTLLVDKQYTEWVTNGGFPLIGFPAMPLLTKGTWYHFVMTNVDPAPTVNWQSFDAMLAKGVTPGNPGQNPDPNSFVEYDTNGANWQKYPTMIAEPVGMYYANGCQQGNSGYQIASDGSTQSGVPYGFPAP